MTTEEKLNSVKKSVSDYRQAKSLKQWLLLKHNIKYQTYRKKKKHIRDALRQEYIADTGNFDNHWLEEGVYTEVTRQELIDAGIAICEEENENVESYRN